jgi:hypothetical protein
MFVPAWSPSRDSLHLVVEAYPDSISTVDHQPVVSSSLASELEVFSTSSETPASSDPRRFKALDWAGRLPLHIAVSAAGDIYDVVEAMIEHDPPMSLGSIQ